MSLADRSWPLLRRLTGVHTHVYRLTNGVVGDEMADFLADQSSFADVANARDLGVKP